MTPVEKLRFKNVALRVLHAPGGPLCMQKGAAGTLRKGIDAPGQAGGARPLEMTLVFDGALTEEEVRAAGADVISALKGADEIFRNVRCNAVWWRSDEEIIHEVVAAPMIQMGRCFDGWRERQEKKRLELLFADLKKFEARSRLLIVAAGRGYVTEDKELQRASLNPFLYRRLLFLEKDGIKEGRSFL